MLKETKATLEKKNTMIDEKEAKILKLTNELEVVQGKHKQKDKKVQELKKEVNQHLTSIVDKDKQHVENMKEMEELQVNINSMFE